MRWVNQFTHTRRLRGPDDKEVVTPNNDTLFTNAWLDLSAGPLVIEVPVMRSLDLKEVPICLHRLIIRRLVRSFSVGKLTLRWSGGRRFGWPASCLPSPFARLSGWQWDFARFLDRK